MEPPSIFLGDALSRVSEQTERVCVALLGGRLDREELLGSGGTLAARHAEVAASVGLNGEMTSVAAIAVQVDQAAAIGTVGCPVPMVGTGHLSSGALSPPPAAAFIVRT
jgi:hypothetical protein